MSLSIDTSHKWNFVYPGEQALPVTIEKNPKTGEFSFYVPYGGSNKGLQITLSLDSKQQLLKGRYKFTEVDLSNEIVFKFLQDTLLEGTPAAYCNREKWVLMRDDHQESKPSPNSKKQLPNCQII
jgi:hypothetical protein